MKLALSINADVVDEHALRKLGGRVGAAGPIAADSEIENNEKRMVENPLAARGPLRGVEGGVEIRINVKADDVWFPLDGIKMEVVREALAGGQAKDSGEIASWSLCTWAVQGTMNGAGFLADIFHDVDLSALRPTGRGDVFAEHPERGPHSLPFWNSDTRLEATVSLGE